MKTVLVFRAADIFMRDLIVNKLDLEGIKTYGADSSINVIYPATPNLYLSGVSAVVDGYRILVSEKDAEKAKQLISELERDLALSNSKTGVKLVALSPDDVIIGENDFLRKFYFYSMFCLFLPIVPVGFAIYYFTKTMKAKNPISITKVGFSFVMIFWNLMTSYFVIKSAFGLF